jgi:hypothetical protein
MVGVLSVNNYNEINEIFELLYGENEYILKNEYDNIIDFTLDNVIIL